jgi:hypothetical protein
VALAFLGCATPDLPGPATSGARDIPEDDDLWAVVPAEAEMVMAFDIAGLRSSPWTRGLLTGAQEASDLKGKGYDPVADVDRMIVVRLPSGPNASLTIARGRFNRERVSAAFSAAHPGATGDRFRSRALWMKGGEAVAFLTERTLLSGPLVSVRAAIDTSYGRARDVREEPWVVDVRRRYGKMPRSPAVELAVRLSDPIRARLRGELEEAEALERLGGRVDLGDRLDLALVGTTSTKPQATALTARLISLFRELQGRPSIVALGLQDVLADVEVASQGPRLAAALRLTESQRNDIALRLSAVAKLIAQGRGSDERVKEDSSQ